MTRTATISTAAAALLAGIAATAHPAHAAEPTTYQCKDSSTLTLRDYEAVVQRAGEIAVALPWAGAASRLATWSPGGLEAVGAETAPFAEYWQPAVGPAQIRYSLDEGVVVHCDPPE